MVRRWSTPGPAVSAAALRWHSARRQQSARPGRVRGHPRRARRRRSGDILWAACPALRPAVPTARRQRRTKPPVRRAVTAAAGVRALARLAVVGGLYVEDEPW